MDQRKLRLIINEPLSNAAEDGLQHDFMPLRPSLKRKRREPSPSDEGVSAVDYRSIEGKAKPQADPGDDDLEYVSDDSQEVESLPAQTEARLRDDGSVLSRRTKERATDPDVWIELIAHQSKLVSPGADIVALTHAERRTLADLRLSIYTQAFKHITKGKPGYDRLLCGMIEESSTVWDRSRLLTKWQEVLKDCPNSVMLWTRYLDFVQTDYIGFTYEKCKTAYIQCLRVLQNSHIAAGPGERRPIALGQIYVLLRFTAFVRDSGYDELAIAIWQVVFEYHFFRPQNVGAQHALIQSLENFWDSDVPRIGEEGALGWRYYVDLDDHTPRHVENAPASVIDPETPLVSFAEAESHQCNFFHLPASTDDECAADDPFRFVMFSDLKATIESLTNDLPRNALVDAFLVFMHLPSLPSGSEDLVAHADAWQTDPFLRVDRTVVDNESTYSPMEGITLRNRRIMVHSLPDDLKAELSCSEIMSSGSSGQAAHFIGRVLERLITVEPTSDTLSEYYVVFQSLTAPAQLGKIAKRLLKARPSSLRLYNVYALSQAQLNEWEKAREIWQTALRMSGTWDEKGREDAVLLHHTWTKADLGQQDESRALQCLMLLIEPGMTADASPTEFTLTAALKLKLSQHLDASFERSLYQHNYGHAVLYADLRAWLSYLGDDSSIESVLPIYKKYCSRLTQSRVALEQLHQLKAELMTYHVQHKRAYKPAVVREDLADSIALFPDNSLILGLYAQNASRFSIDDRLRSTLRHGVMDNARATVVGWSFAVVEELRRYYAAGGGSTKNSVRAAFHQALLSSDSKVRHSRSLWAMWFNFELSGTSEYRATGASSTVQEPEALQRVKHVFLDGMRLMPWSKTWLVDSLRVFASRGGMSVRELRQVYDVLGERELRTRVSAGEMEEALARR